MEKKELAVENNQEKLKKVKELLDSKKKLESGKIILHD